MARHRCFRIFVLTLAIAVMGIDGGATAAERFSDNGDGTVTDHELGLMWGKTDNNGNVNWHQAEKRVLVPVPYTIAKQYANWRMPTLAELQSLVDDRSGEQG